MRSSVVNATVTGIAAAMINISVSAIQKQSLLRHAWVVYQSNVVAY